MRVLLNSGTWTDDEHKGFLRGLEVYGHGNWNAMAVFVLSRSPPQIEAYAQDYMAEKEADHNLQQVILKPSNADHAASSLSGGGRCDVEFGGGRSSSPPLLSNQACHHPVTVRPVNSGSRRSCHRRCRNTRWSSSLSRDGSITASNKKSALVFRCGAGGSDMRQQRLRQRRRT